MALHSAGIYRVLVLVARPALWFTNSLAYGFLRLFGVGAAAPRHPGAQRRGAAHGGRPRPAPLIPARHRQMLLSILDLERVTVNDIMIPRQEIAGIDVRESWEDILEQLRQTPHTRLPVYDGELDNLIGILHMKRVAQELARGTLTRERLIELARGREPYFVPEGTSLNVQLAQFQRNRRRLAFVVNEYGDIEGLVTLEDLLEEIVGEFTTDPATVDPQGRARRAAGGASSSTPAPPSARSTARSAGSCRPAGRRRSTACCSSNWRPSPRPAPSLRVGDYEFEVLQIADNAIRTVRVRAPETPKPA